MGDAAVEETTDEAVDDGAEMLLDGGCLGKLALYTTPSIQRPCWIKLGEDE